MSPTKESRSDGEFEAVGSLDRRTVVAAAVGLSAGAARPSRAQAPAGFLRRGLALDWLAVAREEPWPSTGWLKPSFPAPDRAAQRSALRLVASEGFDFVRLRVQPGPLAADRDAADLGVLTDSVDLALGEGLGVLVSLRPGDAHEVWGGAGLISGRHPVESSAYVDLVGRLAGRLAARPPGQVALEAMAEPSTACAGEPWLDFQARLITAVRGGAASLPLVVNGGCYALPMGLVGVGRPPADPNLWWAFEFHEALAFTRQGDPQATFEPALRFIDGLPWPPDRAAEGPALVAAHGRIRSEPGLSRLERSRLWAGAQATVTGYCRGAGTISAPDRRFGEIAAWRTQHGIRADRILMSGFGVRVGPRGARAADAGRWLGRVRLAAEAAGYGWSVDEVNGPFGSAGGRDAWSPAIRRGLGLRP